MILAKTCALHSRSCLFSRVRRAGLAGSPCAPVSPVGTSAAALDGGRRFVTGLGLQCKPSELMLHLYAVLNEKRIRWRKVNAYRAVYPRYHTGCILRPAPYSLASLQDGMSPGFPPSGTKLAALFLKCALSSCARTRTAYDVLHRLTARLEARRAQMSASTSSLSKFIRQEAVKIV